MGQKTIPSFDELPLRPNDPPFSAWGLWPEQPGLGSLNYLTDELVLKTIKEEVQTGQRVSLNLPLDFIRPAFLGRCNFEKKIIRKDPRVINDDVISFNTQGSSQWDSFRHFAYQPEAKFYNGVTQDDIHANSETTINGIDAWNVKGIAGRGVLVDYYKWAQNNGRQYDPLASHPIALQDIKDILAEQKVELRPGDIFFLRTGFLKGYQSLATEAREEYKSNNEWPGFAQSEESVRWLWEKQFAAVAADNPAFDCTPAADAKYFLHPILLAGWGTPIGELFDLEALSKVCEETKRYSFFLSSAPLNYTGVVASPPNCIAFL